MYGTPVARYLWIALKLMQGGSGIRKAEAD
jgi:hypothetical protein